MNSGKLNKLKSIVNDNKNSLAVIMFSLIIILSNLLLQNYNIAFLGVLIVWLYTNLYYIFDFKNKVFLIIFNFMIFTFILSRPLISILKNNVWWYFSFNSVCKALVCISLTIIFLYVGSILFDNIKPRLNINKKSIKKDNLINNKYINYLLIAITLLTFLVNFSTEIITFIKMHKLDYALVYTDAMPKFNIIIRVLSAMFPYAVFTYLATMPDKKHSYVALFLFVISSVPLFLLGSRNGLILRVLFAVVYLLIRNYSEDKNKWITKKMIIAAVIIAPLGIAFLGAYNYIRSDSKVNTFSIVDLSLDFFYKQGTTFDTVCQGFEYESKLKKDFHVISYSFGDIIDYVGHNTISKKIFKTKDLGNGNNLNMVFYGNSMAHNLSYLALGVDSYLSGHGRGTSYIIETYMDFSYLGVIIYSILLGVFLASITYIMEHKSYVIRLIVITSLFQIFSLPRYSASSFISFIVTPQFWMIPIIIFGFAYILKDKKIISISNSN